VQLRNFTLSEKFTLVIDDDEGLLAEIVETLDNASFPAWGCRNWPETREVVSRGHHPNLILTDLALPGRGGLEIVDGVRNICGSSPPFIVLSGCVTLDEVLRAVRMGVADILVKPMRPESLVDSCRAALIGSNIHRTPAHLPQHVQIAKALLSTMSEDLSDLPRELADSVNLKIMLELYILSPECPVQMKYLVQWAGSNSTASRRVDDLAAAGLIDKKENCADHRRTDITISPKGIETVGRYLQSVHLRMGGR